MDLANHCAAFPGKARPPIGSPPHSTYLNGSPARNDGYGSRRRLLSLRRQRHGALRIAKDQRGENLRTQTRSTDCNFRMEMALQSLQTDRDTGPIAVAARSKARTVFASSNTGIVGSNPT
jgi:hypothetical protein